MALLNHLKRAWDRAQDALAEVTTELRAQQHFDRARAIVRNEGLTEATVDEIVAELQAALRVEGTSFEACARRMLGDAYRLLARNEDAAREYQRILDLLSDAETRRDNERTIRELLEVSPAIFRAEVHTELAQWYYDCQDYQTAIVQAQEATRLDTAALRAYYLWGVSLLALGVPKEQVFEVFMRARLRDQAGIVEGWVEELLPEYLAWLPGREA